MTTGTGATVVITTGNPYTETDNLNGLLTLNSSYSMADTTSRNITFGGSGDTLSSRAT